MSPLYEYHCVCGSVRTEVRSIEDRDKRLKCTACSKYVKREQTPVRGVVKNPSVPRRTR